MNTIRTLSMLTALGLASALSAQALAGQGAAEPQTTPPATGTQPNPASPDSASSPHQRDVTTSESGKGIDKTTEAPTTTQTDPSGAVTPHQRDTVQKPGDTERMGKDSTHKDHKMADSTKPKDKLVGLPVESSTGQQLGSVVDIVRDKMGKPTYAVVAIDNDTTAVPYDTAAMMVRDGKVIMSSTRLSGSPKVKQTEWMDHADSSWRSETDRYWGTTRTASPNEKPDTSTERK
jgi:hypothetical protein